MSRELIQNDPALAALLSGVGVNVTAALDLAKQAREKQVADSTKQAAEAISGLIQGYEALQTSAAVTLLDQQRAVAKTQKDMAGAHRAYLYLMATGKDLPLKAIIGFPVSKDLKDRGLDKVPEDWTPPAAATTAA